MKAIQITRPGYPEIVEVPKPTPSQGEILVRAEYLSICGSDCHNFHRSFPEERYPMPPGFPLHEFVGVVELSNDPNVKLGQRGILLPGGNPNGGANVNGGAEYWVGWGGSFVPISDDADPSTMVVCQPLGRVVDTMQQVGSVLGQSVVVVGQGAIGLSFTMMASLLGAIQVIGVDPLDYRLQAATQHGATATANPAKGDARAVIRSLTRGVGADVVIEASGDVDAVNSVYDYVRAFGRISLFGLTNESVIPFNYAKVMRKSPTIITATTGPRGTAGGVLDAVALVSSHRVDPSWMITHRLSLDDAPAVFEMYDRQLDGVIKVVMEVT